MSHFEDNDTESVPAAALVPESSSSRPSDVPGYELAGEIGHGGMGVVYRARDLTMNREVAVKVLLDRYGPGSTTADRFIAEAQITGQLQHPGIPAVYHVGRLPDTRRPFLAMKLIKGRTLDSLLKLGLPLNVPAVFESIAQAVGYAHAHGVIHRDLKPANIMVGSFGEVQVMDWGLAKVVTGAFSTENASDLHDPDATLARTAIQDPRDSDGSFTVAGSVLGTPAYMAPEQAAGEISKVDRRSDVFGLGAILCALLTGEPPFTGKDLDSIRLAAVRGRTEEAFARLDACGADHDVVELCKRCLSFEPDDRPADASAVASEIAALRAAADERAREAELGRARAEVQAEERTKRRMIVTVSLLLLVAAGITSVALIRSAIDREQSAIDREQLSKKDAALARAEKFSSELKAIEATQRRLASEANHANDVAFPYELVNAFLYSIESGEGDADELKQIAKSTLAALNEMQSIAKKKSESTAKADRKTLQEEIATFEQLGKDYLGERPYRVLLGGYYNLMGLKKSSPKVDMSAIQRQLSGRVGLDPKSRSEVEEALSWFDKAIATLPTDGEDTRVERAGAWFGRVSSLARLGRFTETLLAYDQVELLGGHNPNQVIALGRSTFRVAAEVEQSHMPWSRPPHADHEKAIRMAEALATCKGVSEAALFNVACAYSLASQDSKANLTERQRRGDRAMMYLQKIAAKNYFRPKAPGLHGILNPKDTLKELQTDYALEPLHDRSDFKDLVKAVSEKATPKP